jgi:hypothetical protein
MLKHSVFLVRPALVLGIFLNSGSETDKALRHVTLHEALDDKTLAEVRSLLCKGGQLTAEQYVSDLTVYSILLPDIDYRARYPFCSKDGGSVPENTKFSVYSSMLTGSGEISKQSGEEVSHIVS